MGWNYRVVHRRQRLPGTLGEESSYAIHEVHYDDEGRPIMVSEEASPLLAESLRGLNETRLLMARACQKSVLEWNDIVPPEQDPAPDLRADGRHTPRQPAPQRHSAAETPHNPA